jgi:hypothetical protein
MSEQKKPRLTKKQKALFFVGTGVLFLAWVAWVVLKP